MEWNGTNERTAISASFPIHFLSGGYAFFETSQLPESPKAQNTVSAMLTSPVLKSTGSEGFCVTFSYAMDGLSTDKLRLLLQVHTCHVTCSTNILLETLNIAIYVQS